MRGSPIRTILLAKQQQQQLDLTIKFQYPGAAMRTNPILGKFLALLREYRLCEDPNGFVRQFFTRSNIPPLPGMGLTWWLTRKGLEILQDVARMTVAALPELNLDVDATADMIELVLQEHGDDAAAFDWFGNSDAQTLLDAKSVSEDDLSRTIWNWVQDEARRSVAEWLVVVPLPLVKSASVDLGYDGLFLLRAIDVETWHQVAGSFDHATEWDPRKGVSDDGDWKFHRGMPPQTWGLCRVVGTSDVAKSIARERFRTLIALLFSLEYPSKPELLTKSAT
ncbi:MAG TPA: hypothetical protein VF713_19305, partial [Thermoanaerobaculia bacterium]